MRERLDQCPPRRALALGERWKSQAAVSAKSLLRRAILSPAPIIPTPKSIIAQVAGSGTAVISKVKFPFAVAPGLPANPVSLVYRLYFPGVRLSNVSEKEPVGSSVQSCVVISQKSVWYPENGSPVSVIL